GVGFQRVPGAQRVPVDARLAARDVHVALATRRQRLLRALRAGAEAGLDARILVDRHGALGAVARGDQPQPAALLVGAEALLLVGGLDAGDLRLDPDLQKMRDARFFVVELAVPHAAARAHSLHVPRDDGRAIAHGILGPGRPLQNI